LAATSLLYALVKTQAKTSADAVSFLHYISRWDRTGPEEGQKYAIRIAMGLYYIL
jgi:hypothetical protein